jgi:hypothetical protein
VLPRHAVQPDDEVLAVVVGAEDGALVDAVRREVVDAAFVEPARIATHQRSVGAPDARRATERKGV